MACPDPKRIRRRIACRPPQASLGRSVEEAGARTQPVTVDPAWARLRSQVPAVSIPDQRPPGRTEPGAPALRRNRILLLVLLAVSAVSLLVFARLRAVELTSSVARPSGVKPSIDRKPADQAIGPRLEFLVKRYIETDDPCALPPVEHMADWHGARFLHGRGQPPATGVGAALQQELSSANVRVVHSLEACTGHPWVALVPEYHGREESEKLIGRIASALATATHAERVRVFVEAWSKDVTLRAQAVGNQGCSGLEDPVVYAASRAAWGLLELMESEIEPEIDALPAAVHQALLSERRPRLLVGQHKTRAAAEQAISRYAAFWNAMAMQIPGLEVTHVLLPTGADYLRSGSWQPVHRDARLAIPTDLGAYRHGSRLHFVAQNIAAATSRIRTTEYALHVLETLAAQGEHAAVLQVGANHTHPLVELLERAGAGIAILLTPKSKQWLDQREPWRCPSPLVPASQAGALGYFRLPGRALERKELRPWELLSRALP
jgi:hypothetical protein